MYSSAKVLTSFASESCCSGVPSSLGVPPGNGSGRTEPGRDGASSLESFAPGVDIENALAVLVAAPRRFRCLRDATLPVEDSDDQAVASASMGERSWWVGGAPDCVVKSNIKSIPQPADRPGTHFPARRAVAIAAAAAGCL